MNINKAEFVTSYGSYKQMPASDRIEIAFSGRSNVGKSSLINKIFIRKNRAVIIGECGAPNWGNEKGRAAWDGYMYKTAKSCGIPCFLWDNDAFNLNEQSFGIYDREKGKIVSKKVVDAIMDAVA